MEVSLKDDCLSYAVGNQLSVPLINPFATADAYMRQHFHCLQ